ncbi:MAG: anaerobic sulfatase maturase [Desulfobacterales bacterium]
MNGIKAKPLTNILVKPAGPDCNMRCGYCFYNCKTALFPESSRHRMSDSVLDEMIKQLMRKGSDRISISWQGGEPALAGLPFFQQAINLIQRYGSNQEVSNGFQTNGILLDRAWAGFFRKYAFLVGLSIDGSRHIHDRYRTFSGGRGTFSIVSDTAMMLLDEGVSVNALSVVNDYSVLYPEETYTFLRDIGLVYMQFIPCVEADAENPEKMAPYSVSPERYGAFLCTMFDLWRSDFIDGCPKTSIRFFDSLLFSYAGFEAPECTLQPECGNYLVVEHNGNIYSCDFFVEAGRLLGKIPGGDLASLLNSEKQIAFGRAKSRLPQPCSRCRWLNCCNAGCPKEREMPGSIGKPYLCEAYKIFFHHADQEMRRLVRIWKSRPPGEEFCTDRKPYKAGRNEPCPCGSGLKHKKCCAV